MPSQPDSKGPNGPRDGPAAGSGGRLVGRGDLLAEVRAAVDRAAEGAGQVVLLSGEAGIGKTAVAAEAASYGRERGARVLWASCWQGEGVPGYWPWVQVARALLDPGTPGVASRLLEGVEPDGLGAGDDSDAQPAADGDGGPPEAGRFQLFDELTSALLAEAEARPIVVVLDDLQWADVSSALLLGFLARRLRGSRLLVIGTLRDGDLERGGRLAAALAEVASAGAVVPLAPLSGPEVGELVAATLGRDADPGLVEEISARTGGNPFFVREMSRLLLARGADAGLPIGVSEAVERRLERLGPDSGSALRAAALIGTEVPAALLARVARVPDSAATDLLDEAVRAQVLQAPTEPLGPYRFAHDLFREAIDQRLGAATRAALHLEIALALEAVREAGGTVPAARLARHYVLAAGAGSEESAALRGAVRWSRRAAAEASRRLAHDEAALHWSNALAILDVARAGGPATRIGILLDLGAAHRRAGDVAAARDDYLRVADLARRTRSATALASAALGLHAIGTRSMQPADELVAILEESLAGLATIPEREDAGKLRALVLASLARVLAWFGHDLQRSRSLAEEAVVTARESAGGATTATCLLALHNVIWAPGTAAERLRLADEVIELAAGAGDGELVVEARLLRVADLLELGDPAFRIAMAEFLAAAEGLRQPRLRYLALSRRATLAIMAGELDEAERLVEEAAALAAEIGEPDRVGVEYEQRWELRSTQGRRADLERDRDVSSLAGQDSIQGRGMHVLALIELGELDEAAAVSRPLLDLRPDELPRDYGWTVHLAYATEVLAELGDNPGRLRVYEALAPLEGGAAVIGAAVAFKGAIGHHLGVLAAAMGRRDRAISHFERAVELHEALGARPWQLRSAYELARLLGEVPATVERSRSMLAEVAGAAERMGLSRLGRLASSAGGGARRPAEALAPGPATGTFRRDGSLWTLALGGDSLRMRDAKGLADIATLLARPGRQVRADDLVAASGGAEAAAADLRLGSDQVLDERARRQVRERLADLEDEIDEAEGWGDPDRAARAKAERDALVDELAAATGLGGRSRRLGDQSERARKAVTARIRDAIARIERVHPALGAHLRSSVTTGSLCAYSPADPVDWEL